jgi:hypothetical protein
MKKVGLVQQAILGAKSRPPRPLKRPLDNFSAWKRAAQMRLRQQLLPQLVAGALVVLPP